MGFGDLFKSAKAPKPLFFKGQRDLGDDLFGPGGPLRALFEGGPDPGYEAGVNRGIGNLNSALSSQGLFGSPLGARSAVDFTGKAAIGREQNRLSTLLGAIQPYGTGGGRAQGAGKTFLQGAIGL